MTIFLNTPMAADRFVDALARRDFPTLTTVLAPEVRFRGLVPPGPFASTGIEAAIDRFQGWFGGPDTFTVLGASRERVGTKYLLHWRVRMSPVHDPGAARIADQRLFVTVEHDEVTGIDLLCSGWQPDR